MKNVKVTPQEQHFWQCLDKLLDKSHIVIERQQGSCHPLYHDMVYPLDYGFLAGTTSSDGECIDVWVGHQNNLGLTAVVCTVDLANCDTECKLVVDCSVDEINAINHFYNDWPDTAAYIIYRK